MGGYNFDPLKEKPDLSEAPRMKKATEGIQPYIVQFYKPLTRDERVHIQTKYGLKLTEYIPDFAYLEIIATDILEKLEQDFLLRAIVPYQPAFKIDSRIGKRSFRTLERQKIKGLWLSAVLFPDADPNLVVEMLKKQGSTEIVVINDRKIGGVAQVRFILPTKSKLINIAQMKEVRSIQEVPEPKLDNGMTAGTVQSGTPGTTPIWNAGIHGENQIIGIIDSGIDINHCFFQDNVDNNVRPSHRKVVGFRASGTTPDFHGTFVAGIAVGDDFNVPGAHMHRGIAWAARLTFSSIGNSSMFNMLNSAAIDGAAIHTNSWHDDDHGRCNSAPYNLTAFDVDTFTWNNEDHLVLGSAGNSGEEQGAPGTAKNAICVNASQADPNEMNFGDGNKGPTSDGRRKADLMAPGCGINSADVNTPCGIRLSTVCATSWATPAAAGSAALVRQYYLEGFYPTGTQQPHHSFTPSGALLKATLLNSTIDMNGTVGDDPCTTLVETITLAGYPGIWEGWGLIRLNNVLYFPGSLRNLRVWDTRNTDGLNTGETRVHRIDVASGAQPLKVTLVWTDPPPAEPTSSSPVVNNLNLEVVSPDGTQTFLGNLFDANGVSTTGGTSDGLNNIEMVLVNNPASGEWIVRVVGTQVNVGNPGQGYALVVTADLTEPPVSTGQQDTLVVRVKFADVSFEPSMSNLQNLMADVAEYIEEVSYGESTVVPVFRGSLTLDHNKDYYYHPDRNPLIELTEEVVAKLVTVEPGLFNSLERMIIVTNDVNFISDWATTGPWPYSMPGGFTRPISVSIQSYVNSVARFTHGILHQFGLVDLYAHEGVLFPRPYVDEWDNMGGLYNNVHPLIWSKERAGWLTAHGDTIHYIPRPAPGANYGGINPIPIFRNTSDSSNRKGIAIGLSHGAATLAAENVFYFIEARSNSRRTYDNALPGSGVLIYYVNELVPQGEGPVILRDKNLLTQSLNDCYFAVGDVIVIPGTGITITVQSGTGGADFNIQVDYTAPVTDFNLSITRGDTIDGKFYPYYSPDIWIDSPKNGFNLSSGPSPPNQRENPVEGQVNHIHARVHNDGPATAFDFDVKFSISEPWHTVGGEGDFDKFVGIKHINSLGPGMDTGADLFVEWTPQTGIPPHSCVRVDLINLVGTDTNEQDNWAQENLEIVSSITASPFHPVTFSYNLTNPYNYTALFYLRAEGAPDKWNIDLNPYKIRLNPGERIVGQVIITPPEDGKICTSERIQVTSWTPRGDTLINVGGAVVQVDLRRATTIKLDVDANRCHSLDVAKLIQEAKEQGKDIDPQVVHRRCGRLSVHGCTVPPIPGQEIILKYVDPLGNVTYHTVKTDQNGCFEDFFVSTTGGTWIVSAEYPGGNCEAPVTEGPISVCWCHN